MKDDLKKIDKWGEYFHLELLKYYYNFINFYKQEENLPSEFLYFDFGDDGIYIIEYKDLQEKAFEESEILKNKHSDTNNYKI